MKTNALAAAVVIAALAAGSTAAKADLLVNGGFETGNPGPWTVTGDNTGVAATGFEDLTAHSGTDFLAMGDDITPFGTISQSVSDTAGQTLTLSYWFASNGTNPNSFAALWNSNVIAGSVITNTGPVGYTEYSFDVTATGSDTVSFDEFNQNQYSALDDISLVPVTTGSNVPEPASLALFGLALGGLGFARARRK